MSILHDTAPLQVYLQVGEFAEPEDCFQIFEEVTWTDHRIYETDIEYIRKDVFDVAVRRSAEIADQVRPLIMHLAKRYDSETMKWGGAELKALHLARDLGWIKDEDDEDEE